MINHIYVQAALPANGVEFKSDQQSTSTAESKSTKPAGEIKSTIKQDSQKKSSSSTQSTKEIKEIKEMKKINKIKVIWFIKTEVGRSI